MYTNIIKNISCSRGQDETIKINTPYLSLSRWKQSYEYINPLSYVTTTSRIAHVVFNPSSQINTTTQRHHNAPRNPSERIASRHSQNITVASVSRKTRATPCRAAMSQCTTCSRTLNHAHFLGHAPALRGPIRTQHFCSRPIRMLHCCASQVCVPE